MSVRRAALLGIVLTTACSPISFPQRPAPVYYQLQYDAAPVSCPQPAGRPLRVWEFAEASPFDRAAMVVTDGDLVSPSSGFQWVSRPGVLVAQSLIRDLGLGQTFPAVVGPGSPVDAPLELTGRIFQFAWNKAGGSARAVLALEVSLVRARPDSEVLFRHMYRLASPPSGAAADSGAFASAMSGLMAEFSARLQTDLCNTLSR